MSFIDFKNKVLFLKINIDESTLGMMDGCSIQQLIQDIYSEPVNQTWDRPWLNPLQSHTLIVKFPSSPIILFDAIRVLFFHKKKNDKL